MQGNVFDIINSDAFSLTSMVSRFDTIEFQPGQAIQLGVWTPDSINTRMGLIEFRDQTMTLVNPSDRGAPGQHIQDQNRVMRSFEVPHFQQNDTVKADEVVGVREFGTNNEFQTVEKKISRKLMIGEANFSATEEYMAITGLQGVTKAPNGTTLLDSYALSNTTKRTTLFGANNIFDIGASNTANATNPMADSRLLLKCHTIVRQMRTDLRQGSLIPRPWVFASPGWMDAFTTAIEVKNAFQRFTEIASLGQVAAFLREGAFFGTPPFYYGGVWFEEYRGSGIVDNEAIAFPLMPAGSQSIYDVTYAPADYIETVNTLGRPRYAKVLPDPSGANKFITVEMQMNVIYYSRRPLALYTLAKS
jgi:hypothetical protein